MAENQTPQEPDMTPAQSPSLAEAQQRDPIAHVPKTTIPDVSMPTPDQGRILNEGFKFKSVPRLELVTNPSIDGTYLENRQSIKDANGPLSYIWNELKASASGEYKAYTGAAEKALEKIGIVGGAANEAIRGGFSTMSRMIGYEERPAEAVGKVAEMIAGLPTPEMSTGEKALLTGAAALPLVGGIIRTGRGAFGVVGKLGPVLKAEGRFVYPVLDAKGQALGELHISPDPDSKTIAVNWLGPEKGAQLSGSKIDLGPEGLKNIASELAAAYPDMGKVTFNRFVKGDLKPHSIDLTPFRVTATPVDEFRTGLTTSIQEARRGVRPVRETMNEAKAMIKGMGQEQFAQYTKEWLPGVAANAEEAAAVTKFVASETGKWQQLARRGIEGDQRAVKEFRTQFGNMLSLFPPQAGITAEAGRTEQIFRVLQPEQQYLLMLQKVLHDAPPGVTESSLMHLIAGAKDLSHFSTIAAKAKYATGWDGFTWVWVNGLLSNPVTHGVNFMSNAMVQAWAIPENMVARLIGKAFGTRYAPNEDLARVKGIFEGFMDGLQTIPESLTQQAVTDVLTKTELATSAERVSAKLAEYGTAGRAADYAVSLPGRLLVTSDNLFKAIAYRTELRVLANREAFRYVEEQGLAGAEAATGFDRRVAEVLKNPEQYPQIERAARDYSSYETFTRELTGWGKDLQNMVAKYPAMRLLVPFIRTPGNIFKYVGERTPFALFSKSVWADIQAGGTTRDLALARMSLGSMMGGVIANSAMEGNFTGGGPADPKLNRELQATGWRPYSKVTVGSDGRKVYTAYDRYAPIGQLMAASADLAEIVKLSGEESSDKIEHMTAALVASFSRVVTGQSFVQGAFKWSAALASKDLTTWETFSEQIAPTLIPFSGLSKATRRWNDPIMRDAQSIIDAYKNAIPFTSSQVTAQYNVWGYKRRYDEAWGPDWISAAYMSSDKRDDVLGTLVNHEIVIGPPPKKLSGYELSPRMQERFNEIRGHEVQLGGVSLRERLGEMMATGSQWHNLSPEDKKQRVSSVVSAYQLAAKRQLREEFSVLDEALQAAGDERQPSKKHQKPERTQAGIPRGLGIAP